MMLNYTPDAAASSTTRAFTQSTVHQRLCCQYVYNVHAKSACVCVVRTVNRGAPVTPVAERLADVRVIMMCGLHSGLLYGNSSVVHRFADMTGENVNEIQHFAPEWLCEPKVHNLCISLYVREFLQHFLCYYIHIYSGYTRSSSSSKMQISTNEPALSMLIPGNASVRCPPGT